MADRVRGVQPRLGDSRRQSRGSTRGECHVSWRSEYSPKGTLHVNSSAIEFPIPLPPKPHELIEAARGIFWLRLPLPFRLDHVNVYLIEDGDGFALIDAGIDNAVSREMWEALLEGPLRVRPLTRILVTHFHPDHIGLAGWLCRRFDLQLHASQTEYLDALCIRLDPGALNSEAYRGFY